MCFSDCHQLIAYLVPSPQTCAQSTNYSLPVMNCHHTENKSEQKINSAIWHGNGNRTTFELSVSDQLKGSSVHQMLVKYTAW